jgi:pyrimidine-nucleoside phosphorylase
LAPDARQILRTKRDGHAHDPSDLSAFVAAYAKGEVPDYQMSAWLMAAFLRGLDDRETDALTRSLLESGRTFDWSDLGRPSADKHSTGGVGDKISLILAPLVAACGVLVPMVSGRGLGHTGGTLDKLESIPGFRTRLEPDAMRAQLDRIGVVMVGQGPDLAPADGMLYALRDVTSTVEYEPFIVSSIVSKKIAEGAGAIVYDVKHGGGAFMKERERAEGLARRLVRATRALGRGARALITDMSQPLGRAVGNALEVRESIEVLKGGGPASVRTLTLELAAEMLHAAGADRSLDIARERATRALDSGAAWERFVDLVEAQGGDARTVEDPDRLPKAAKVVRIESPSRGFVSAVDAGRIGERVVRMGGGRRAKEDAIDPGVGIMIERRVGDAIEKGDVLAELRLAAEDAAAVEDLAACFTIADQPVAAVPLIAGRMD